MSQSTHQLKLSLLLSATTQLNIGIPTFSVYLLPLPDRMTIMAMEFVRRYVAQPSLRFSRGSRTLDAYKAEHKFRLFKNPSA